MYRVLPLILLTACVQPITRTLDAGRRAKRTEVYATVAITTNQMHTFCSGTAIAPKVVITAAHCVVWKHPSMILVSSGYRNVTSSWSFQRVKLIYVYKDFPDLRNDASKMGRYDDIATLILKSDVRVSWVPILPMNKVNKLLRKGTEVLISGYGRTNGKSGKLHIATTPFLERSPYEFKIGGAGKSDHCKGDSGGPTYIKMGGQLYLVGATSRSRRKKNESCGKEGGINTLVPAYIGWIKSHSNGLYPPKGPPPPPRTGCSTAAKESHAFTWLLFLLLWVRVRKMLGWANQRVVRTYRWERSHRGCLSYKAAELA